MDKKVGLRSEVDVAKTWDLRGIYENDHRVKEAEKALCEKSVELEKEFRGKLTSSESINLCLDGYREVVELAGLISSFRFLAVSVDMTDHENQGKSVEAGNLISDVMARLSFIQGEILMNEESVLMDAAKTSRENQHSLEDLLREKPHALSIELERALAVLPPVMNSPMSI